MNGLDDIVNVSVGDSTVTLLGVRHTRSVFQKHHEFFRDSVQTHDAVVLENAVILAGDFRWDPGFFGQFADLAHAEGKKVYCADAAPFLETTFLKRQIDFCRKTVIVSAFAQPALFAMGLPEFGILAGACLASGLYGYLDVTQYGFSLARRKWLPWTNVLAHTSTDYRNIKIAEGIRDVVNVCGEKSLLGVHGTLHNRGIAFYLKHPRIAAEKKKYYALYEEFSALVGNETVRQYRPRSLSEARASLQQSYAEVGGEGEPGPDFLSACPLRVFAWEKRTLSEIKAQTRP